MPGVLLSISFDEPKLYSVLEQLSSGELDGVEFGVVRMDSEFSVLAYNAAESRLSGLPPSRVLGKRFFSQVATCTDNHMVADRYEDAPLDETIDYVFTYRMQPTPVRLRMLRTQDGNRYLCVQPKA